MAGSPSVLRIMEVRPSSSMSWANRLTSHRSPWPFWDTLYDSSIPVSSSLTTMTLTTLSCSVGSFLAAEMSSW